MSLQIIGLDRLDHSNQSVFCEVLRSKCEVEKLIQCRHFVSKILEKSMEMMEYVELKHKI